jgi:hypothetical protein
MSATCLAASSTYFSKPTLITEFLKIVIVIPITSKGYVSAYTGCPFLMLLEEENV